MKINKYIYSLVAAFAFLFTACSPDTYSLGDKNLTSDDLVEGVAYTIEHDASNPNIVYLKSLLPSSYTILWDEPQGRSQLANVTLKMPFAGTYKVRMGVETRGGVVYGPETTFTVDKFYADFVSDPLWTTLSGGVNKSKKWYLDIDSKAVCRYFVGPLYFYGTADNWNSVTLGQKVTGDTWSWAADWAGNTWVLGSTGAMDYGYMEFDLKNGANLTVVDNAAGKTYHGTYMLDADNHTMKLTDAPVLHDPGRESIVTQWGNVTVLALDENHMQLAVLRDNSTEGKCLLSYNFISEDYLNNWTPTVDNTPVTPTLAADWRDYVEPKTQNIVTYKLSEDDTPFDWCGLDGKTKGITSFSAVSGIGDLKLVMNHKTNEYTCTAPDGTVVSGTYSLTDKGIYTFSNGLPVVQLSQVGNANFKANADKTLRIMQTTTDAYSGSLKDLWLGSQMVDDQGNLYQYLGYHFIPQTSGDNVVRYTSNLYTSSTVDYVFTNSENVYITGDGDYTATVNGTNTNAEKKIIYLQIDKILKDHPNADIVLKDIKIDGKSITFDDATVSRTVDDKNVLNGRRYIYNPWTGDADSPIKAAALDFNSSISVTFHVTYDSGSVVLKK